MSWIESSNGCSRPFVFVRTGGRIDRDSGTGDMRLRGGCCAGGGDKHRLLFGDPSIRIGSSRSIVVSKSSERKSELDLGRCATAVDFVALVFWCCSFTGGRALSTGSWADGGGIEWSGGLEDMRSITSGAIFSEAIVVQTKVLGGIVRCLRCWWRGNLPGAMRRDSQVCSHGHENAESRE